MLSHQQRAKRRPIRLHPRQRAFINGGHRYNPVIDAGAVRTQMQLVGIYTACLADRREGSRPVGSVIALRARLARFAREYRRRLWAGR